MLMMGCELSYEVAYLSPICKVQGGTVCVDTTGFIAVDLTGVLREVGFHVSAGG